ncbi:Helix-turn-helix domain-containing protein [Bowdeniella nasicola]|uniref:Helix-turn-helix domain-containing protein n=2 Tax=Bowdeniella nasicola TaxID=208480 RepID=A0A1H4DYL0_9ACTO|nr:Helix-turn-helix domain-containing protein [Bowdeniella nasicola]
MMKNMTHPGAGTRPAQRSNPRAIMRQLAAPAAEPIVLREVIGAVLREIRLDQGRTLREVSSAAQVSLGYLSEVERGQKEASSELLASICDALDYRLSHFLKDVALRVNAAEQAAAVVVPDTIPANLTPAMPRA